MLLCRTIKSLSIPSADKYSKKHLEVREADASKQVDANVREGGNKNCSSLYYSDSNSDTATRKTRIKAQSEAQLRKASEEEELAKTKKKKREKEAWEREARSDSLLDSNDYCSDSSPDINPEDDSEDEEATTAKDLAREQKERLKALLNAKMRDSLSARLTGAYILYFKELSSNNGRIFASDTFTSRTRRKCEMPKQKSLILRRRTSTSSHNNDYDLLVVRFCIFSDPALENIGILTNEEVVEMQTDTATALADKLAAVNKSVRLQTFILKILEHVETTILEANTPAVHSKATKHYPAPSAARFVIVCSFRKVDKHVFRAYNTISVTAQRTIIRKGGSYVEKRAILLSSHVTFNATDKRDSVTGDRIYKMEDAVYWSIAETLSYRTRQNTALNSLAMAKQYCLCLDFLSTVQNAKQQCRDILKKEGLNESEASRRVIFNCFKMQAIASYSALATLKAAQFKTYGSCKVKRFTLNSVKDLFTNLSKDYFLVREARAITKSSLKFQNLSNLCSKLGLREKFSDESVLVMQGGITQDLDRPWIIVALIAFAEAIILTEATHVVIMEPQDRQNTQDQFMF
ncbi:hypothetical protein HBI29_242300 [Parastagonospora nodorum]|nr:hypothetical protein HBI29_242300 [Parastagonospora nodorum]